VNGTIHFNLGIATLYHRKALFKFVYPGLKCIVPFASRSVNVRLKYSVDFYWVKFFSMNKQLNSVVKLQAI